MNIQELNTLSHEQAVTWFMQTCTSAAWCELMAKSRPFDSIEQVRETASTHWSQMAEADFIEAFHGHPMIGDIESLRAKYANTKALAANEQSGASQASEAVLLELKAKNHAYLDKHGFIFIICATGLSAQTMLNALLERLDNDTQVELANAGAEQIKITLLRINKGLTE